MIFTDSDGGTYQEELLYTSTPTEENPEEESYVVFEVSDFSQYAVAYNEGTAAENNDTGDGTVEGHAESADKEGTVTPVDQDTDDNKNSGEKAEALPNTGVAENGLLYSIATFLGALGLGTFVFSRKRKN